MLGYISRLESLGTVDGPGVRAVVFAQGCPLRCACCHNPETQGTGGEASEHTELAARIMRLYPYIKNGGVTFSGGEPCLQARFFLELAGALKDGGLHLALDTSGAVINDDVVSLLRLIDLVLLDIKFPTEEEYLRYTGGSLTDTLRFLDLCENMGTSVWIRSVIIPGINDTEHHARALLELVRPYTVVEKIEPLPFRKLCLEKYEQLNMPFPLRDTPEMSEDRMLEIFDRPLKDFGFKK